MYAITTITFNLKIKLATNNPDLLVYLNTSYKVIFIDKTRFAKKLFSQKINTIFVPLKIRGIDAFQHMSREFALAAI